MVGRTIQTDKMDYRVQHINNRTIRIVKGVGSKLGVVRPGACEVNVAVLCAKAVRADGYLSVARFLNHRLHDSTQRRRKTFENWGGGGRDLFVCMRKHARAMGSAPSEKCCKLDALRVLLRPLLA